MADLRQTYQLQITLNHIEPPIWRRLLVSSATDLSDLHRIFQVAMGWTDTHLHQFIIGDKRYGNPDPDFDDGTIEESGIRIGQFLKRKNDELLYEYDFGDGWEHRVLLEDILPFSPGQALPRCTGGQRGCPPEDVGGPWGYEEFLEAYRNETHPEHQRMKDWAGDYFHPDHFNRDEVNEMLSEYPDRE